MVYVFIFLLQFNTEVKAVKPIDSTSRDTKWTVTYGDIRYHNEDRTEEFDAVVVCNGYVLLILVFSSICTISKKRYRWR